MIRATRVRAAGSWTETAADAVVLDFDDRHRRRTMMTGVQGVAFLLDLPEAVMLRGGDALLLEDGRLVEVVAAPEALVEIRGARPGDLVRLAWHIGNRHLPAQILTNAIRIRRDHVIEDMLQGLGAKVAPIEGPFDPEGGAYATAGHHSQAGAQGQGHDHGGDTPHGHRHDHGAHGYDEHPVHDAERHEHHHVHKHDP